MSTVTNTAGAEHKDRLINQLKQEATELRQRERDYKTLQDQLLNLESNFNHLNEEKRRMDDDYKSRIESNLVFVANLRNEIDDQKHILTDRKKQNSDLYIELERQKDNLDHRSVEISRLRGDLTSQSDLNASLQAQKKQLEEDFASLRERNREDSIEIDKLNVQNDQHGKESVDLAAKIRTLEYDISKSLSRIDDLNRLIDQKSYDLKAKDTNLGEAENEVIKLKAQLQNYQNELEHLKSLEDRYKQENSDLQKRIDSEGSRNVEINQQIKEIELKIRSREEQIMSMRKELDSARYSNSALLDNNSNLQVEIDALNNHIRVLSAQNEDLTKELDQFVEANEAIRMRLDRKNRVLELRNRNEQQIQKSIAHVQDTKSPVRHR